MKKYTFTYESDKFDRKTVTVSFEVIGEDEEAVLKHFFDFMKATGRTFESNEVLAVVDKKLRTAENYQRKVDLRYPPTNFSIPSFNPPDFSFLNKHTSDPLFGAVPPMKIDPKSYDNFFDGLPGISEETFIKPKMKIRGFDEDVSANTSLHGHGVRGFVGPADC